MNKISEINLCDTCSKEFAICKSTPKFGNGFGDDNVCECSSYMKRTEVALDEKNINLAKAMKIIK